MTYLRTVQLFREYDDFKDILQYQANIQTLRFTPKI
jgi:hypothetical protein